MHLLLVVRRRAKRRRCAAFMIPQTPPRGKAGSPAANGRLTRSPAVAGWFARSRGVCGKTARFPSPVGRGLDPAVGRSAADFRFTHLPAVFGRFVGAACMRPVGVRLMIPFLVRVRGTLICRGGIYASRQGCAPRGVPGKIARFPRFVRRGLDPAADGCLMGTFFGKEAKPVPCVIRFGFFARHSPFLFVRPKRKRKSRR